MARSTRLPEEDRAYLTRVAAVVFANPFGTEPSQLEPLLGRAPKPGAGDHLLAELGPAVEARLERLEGRGVRTLSAVVPEDRELLGHAFLFQAYDRFVDLFDQLIERQAAKGDEPADVPFASDLLRQLAARGFPEAEAMRLVALFYQIRRAYHFIAGELVGGSPSMQRLRRALWNNVFTSDILAYREHLWDRMEDFSTLLLGETGTGKGTAAAAIGRSGLIPFDRKTGRFADSFTRAFLAINLSQFPESLLESELFGHRKGSFTGAIDDYDGIFQRCSPHGALLLDEIGDLAAPVQLKLLNVLQERRFRPVGGRRTLRFEGRVIAATNREIRELRREGRFRDDFFYRLSSDVIEVPPLRDRLREHPRELDELVALLLSRMTGHDSRQLTESVLAALRRGLPADYAWPGNVRELEQALRRILVTGAYGGEAGSAAPGEAWLERASGGDLTAEELLREYCRMLHRRYGTYEEVARRTALDRRTVKKHIQGDARQEQAIPDRG